MAVLGPRRIALVVTLAALLSGCAGSATTSREAPEDYFAWQLPGLSSSVNPMMSPVDNPLVGLGSLHLSSPERVRAALLAQHEHWVGTPYRLGGTGYNGIDCSALVQSVFNDTFHLQLPRSTSEMVREGIPVAREALEVGDLVFFRPPGPYNHVGIYVGDGSFLHASTSQGVMLSELDNSYWRRHFWQARRTLESTALAQRVTTTGESRRGT